MELGLHSIFKQFFDSRDSGGLPCNIAILRQLSKVENLNFTSCAGDQHALRYDTRCHFNVRSKADISQLNLPHGAKFHQNRSNVAEIWRFNDFQNGGRPSSCFWIFYRSVRLRDPFCTTTQNYVKIVQTIAIFVIFKMAVAAILDFQKFEILMVGPL